MRYVAALAVVIPLASSPAAAAQMQCDQPPGMKDKLAAIHAERPVATGADYVGNPVTFYMSDKGTWTLVALLPVGLECILAHGGPLPLEGTPS